MTTRTGILVHEHKKRPPDKGRFIRLSPATPQTRNKAPRFSRTRALAVALAILVASFAGVSAVGPQRADASTRLIHAALWYDSPNGTMLIVIPTGTGVAEAGSHPQEALWDAVGMAGFRPYSPQVYNSLLNQLRCHADFVTVVAPERDWRLDTWRPDVGYLRTVLASCNP